MIYNKAIVRVQRVGGTADCHTRLMRCATPLTGNKKREVAYARETHLTLLLCIHLPPCPNEIVQY
jgi:hypothetical protein